VSHVLVTGGAGFIGSHVVRSLLGRGHRVRVVDDLSSGLAENVPAEAEFVRGDVADPDVLREVVADTGAVVHLAAIASVTRSVEAPSATHEVNLTATIRLAEAAVAEGVGKFVYASSAAVYGAIEREAHHEGDPPAPATPYAIDKLAGEWYLRFFAATNGLDVRSLRFFNVYGPRQPASSPYAGVITRFASDLLSGATSTIHGDGLQTRDFVYVSDVAAVVGRHTEDAATPGSADVMNVCTGVRTSVDDLHGILVRLTGAEPRVEYGPERPGDVKHSCGSPERLTAYFPDRPRTALSAGLRELLTWMASA
jgi:UDP-glucose 4-epimerase